MTRPRSTRPRPLTAAAVALVATVALVAASLWGGGVSAQEDPVEPPPRATTPLGPLRLERASSWVEPEGTWSARFEVVDAAPLDSTVVVSVRRSLAGDVDEVREQMADLRAGGDLPSSLQNEIRTPIGDLLTPGALTVDLPIRDRSGEPDRTLIPNPGIHPVEIRLESADGEVLQRQRLFLNRLPRSSDDAQDAPLQLALLLAISSAPTVGADSVGTVPPEAIAEVERAVELLEDHPDLPVTLQPEPHLLDALAAAGSEETAELLARLGALLRSNETLRQTWVDLDLEAWTAEGRPPDLHRSIVAGQATLVGVADVEPDGRTWGEDPTIGPASVPALRQIGVDQLVLTAGQVGPESIPAEEVPTTGPIEVTAGGETLEGLVIDPTLQFLLNDPEGVPAEIAHQVASEVQAIWFADDTDAVPAMVLPIDDRTPTGTAAALMDALDDSPTATLEVTDLANAFERGTPPPTAQEGGEEVTRTVRSATPLAPVASLSSYLAQLRPRDTAHQLTVGEVEGLVPIRWLLLGSQDRNLTEPDQRARLDEAAGRIDRDFAALQAPRSRSVTVTSRRATLPLQLSNGLDRPARVEVRFSGARLEVEGGRRRSVELEPGINRLDIPVIARTSGQFEITVELRTAGGEFLLDETRVRIRSTVFSGVGLLIGGGALAFLAVWWLRSWRRSRRTPTEEEAPVA